MTGLSILFSLHCVVICTAALVGIFTTRGVRTSISCFLLAMSSLAGVFVLLGAHAIAIAQLFFCAGIGLAYFFVAEVLDAAGDGPGRDSKSPRPHSWQWLIIMLGIAGATTMGDLLFGLLSADAPTHSPGVASSTRVLADATGQGSFAAVANTVLVEQGIALIGVGLLLLTALVGGGYLGRRGLD